MSDSQCSVVCTVHSPMTGKLCSLEDVPDPAFAHRIIGDGVAIVPQEPEIYMPLDGKVISVFETKHAIVLEDDARFRVLMHVGIGTMRLQGKGFEAHVKNGQKAKKGEKLLSMDLEFLREKAEALASPIVITRPRDWKRYEVRVIAEGHVAAGEPLFEVVEIPK